MLAQVHDRDGAVRVHFTDAGRPPTAYVNGSGIYVDLGRSEALKSEREATAAALRGLARSALAAAEALDPQWAGLEFGVCLGGVEAEREDGGTFSNAHALDAVDFAVRLYERERTCYGDDGQPVQILVWPADDETAPLEPPQPDSVGA